MNLPPELALPAEVWATEAFEEIRLPADEFARCVTKHDVMTGTIIVEIAKAVGLIPECFSPTEDCIAAICRRVIDSYNTAYAGSF